MIRAMRYNPIVENGKFRVIGPNGIEVFDAVYPEHALYRYADKYSIPIFVDLRGWTDYTLEFSALHVEMLKAPRRLKS